MSRPMSRDETGRLMAHLQGRRFALFVMAEKWVRHLEISLPIAWEQMRQDRIENMVLTEMARRESQLPVRCLCEETYVLETIWRLVTNDEAQKATAARLAALEAQVDALGEQYATQATSILDPTHIEAQIKIQERLEAQLAGITRRGEDPSPLLAEP